jgi:hypothetical protein
MIELDNIALPEFIWQNRGGYSPWRVTQEYSLDGSQHIEAAAVKAGRSIVLYSDSAAADLFTELDTHAAGKGATSFSLVINASAYSVMWDYSAQPVTGTPTLNFADDEPESFDGVTLRLITV